MTHALAMRATSLAVSGALLGAAVLFALSATWMVQSFVVDEGAITTSVVEEPPTPPVEPPRIIRDTPPQSFDPIVADTPPSVFNDTFEPVETSLPVFSGPVSIETPHWLERPRDLARYYPRRAIAREMEGQVLLDCIVATSGRLSCGVIAETPRGWGFGEAALAIAADHRMAPATRDGVAVQGRYRMRVPFELD